MKSIGLLVAIVFTALTAVTASLANAGEILRMKSGDVDLRVLASRMSAPQEGEHVYAVQFQNHVTREDRQNLTTLGAQILRYLPDDALVVRASAKTARTIEGSSSAIRAVSVFDDQWKISPSLGPANVFSAQTRSTVHVRLFPLKSEKDEQRAQNKLRSLSGVEVMQAQGRSLIINANRAQIAQIAHDDNVEWIQPNPKFETMHFRTTDDPEIGADAEPQPEPNGDYTDLTGYESGTKVMNFDGAWAKGFTGKNQIVAMADTGLDSGDINAIHPDFTGKVQTGLIFGFFSKSWGDPMGHGTHVAGSVLGSGTQSKGALKGGAHDAMLVAESMWSPMLGGLAVPPKLSDLYDKAYAAGARVHTNSWGKAADFGGYDSFAQQTDEFMSSHPDMLIVFAAGNSGVDDNKDGRIDDNSIGSPGTAKNVLTVGASKNLVAKGGIQKMMKELRDGAIHWGAEPIASSHLSENAGGLAAFSSRGPTQDGRIKPEIVAPGTNILSTRSHDPAADPLWGPYNKDYTWSGGTSMATPLTSGAVTVIRQFLVEKRGFTTPSAALMKATIIHSATDLFPGEFGEIGKDKGQEILNHRPNTDEGFGLVNVARATSLDTAVMVDERAGVGAGETLSYPVNVSGKAHLTATLVWTDAAAADGAAKSLVNDLDLVLVNTANGNQTALNDHVNNTEMIEADVAPGSYEVRVKGANVPQGPASGKQPFAVVVSVQ